MSSTVYLLAREQFSNKTSDTWIAYRHSQIQILKPKVLVVNFVNPTLGTTRAETLVNTIIRAFADGSRPRGNMTAAARLQYQIAKFVNLRGTQKLIYIACYTRLTTRRWRPRLPCRDFELAVSKLASDASLSFDRYHSRVEVRLPGSL